MSWLWRGRATEGAKDSPGSEKKKSKPTKAHLGDKSKFYFNEKLKRWCVEGEEDQALEEETVAPPPISRNVSTDFLSNQGGDSGEDSFGGKPAPISLPDNNGNQAQANGSLSASAVSSLPGSPRRGASLRQRYYDPGYMSGGGGGSGGGDSKATSLSEQSAYAKELLPQTMEAQSNKPITLFVPQMRNPNPEDSVSNRKSSVDNLNPPSFNSPWDSEDYKTTVSNSDADTDADAYTNALNGTTGKNDFESSSAVDPLEQQQRQGEQEIGIWNSQPQAGSSSSFPGQEDHLDQTQPYDHHQEQEEEEEEEALNQEQHLNKGGSAFACEGDQNGDEGFGKEIPDQYGYLDQQNAFQYDTSASSTMNHQPNRMHVNGDSYNDLAGLAENAGGDSREGYAHSANDDVFASQPLAQSGSQKDMNQVVDDFGYHSNYHTTNSSYDDFGSVQEHFAEGGGEDLGEDPLRGALENNDNNTSAAASTMGNYDEAYKESSRLDVNGYNEASGHTATGEGLYYNGDTSDQQQQQQLHPQQEQAQYHHQQWHSVDSDSQLGLDQPYDAQQSYDNSSNMNNHSSANMNVGAALETGGESSAGGMIAWEDHFQQLEEMASRVKQMERERDAAQEELQKEKEKGQHQQEQHQTLAFTHLTSSSNQDAEAESSGGLKEEEDFPSTPASQAIQIVPTNPLQKGDTYSTIKRSLHEKIEELELNDLERHKLLLENYRLQESLKQKDEDISNLQSDMNDLLVCLGQESAKVQALIPFAEHQLGENVESFLSKVEEESIAEQAAVEEEEEEEEKEEEEEEGYGEVESII